MVHQKEYRRAKNVSAHKAVSEDQATEAMVIEHSDPRKRKLICSACNAKITYEEASSAGTMSAALAVCSIAGHTRLTFADWF